MKAFPSNYDPQTGAAEKGMELRDYFAAMAMQAITPILFNNADPDTIFEDIARDAYLLANEMMEKRNE